ncbi:MAG: hypothetical protein FWC12_07625 [Treponema sp.]|nr:hypothetical protein [Treponema sp.]
MAFKEKSMGKPSATDNFTFSDVVDKACDGLMDCQIKYTIRRLLEMRLCLDNLEKELDDFLSQKDLQETAAAVYTSSNERA